MPAVQLNPGRADTRGLLFLAACSFSSFVDAEEIERPFWSSSRVFDWTGSRRGRTIV